MFARRDLWFPRLGFSSRMLGFRDPFEDFFLQEFDDMDRLGNLWSEFGMLTPDATQQHIAPVTDSDSKVSATEQTKSDSQQKAVPATEDKQQLQNRPEGQGQSVVSRTGSDWLQSYLRAPQVEVVPKENEFLVRADIPGVRKEDIKVNIAEDASGRKMLNISGERKEEEQQQQKDKDATFTSRRYGKFTRSLLLPDGAAMDNIKAKVDNGVLQITLPKVPKPVVKPMAVDVTID